MAKFVNSFLVGADPELVLVDPPRLIRATDVKNVPQLGFFGFDHGNYILEPHPTPSLSVRAVCHNIRASLDYMSLHYGNYKARAGAHFEDPRIRTVTMGGHVHIDVPAFSPEQVKAMDYFTASLEHLDILPKNECKLRSDCGAGYGRKGDVRNEHGHSEYRSMCSWLFSRKTSMLAMTGIKLCVVAPKTLKKMTSVAELTTWLEGFKEADDDVRWILDKDYFGVSMEANPDASVFKVWRSDAVRGASLAKIGVDAKVAQRIEAVQQRVVGVRLGLANVNLDALANAVNAGL